MASNNAGSGARLVLWLLLLGFGGATLCLAAEHNSRRWTLQLDHDRLVVSQGRHFVIGERRIESDDAELGKVYGPFPVPAGTTFSPAEFGDQIELDRALLEALLPAVRAARTAPEIQQAEATVTRLAQLPGLTAAELEGLALVRGDFAFDEARSDLREAGRLLHDAWRKLQLVQSGNGEHALEAAAMAPVLSGMAATLDDLGEGRSPRPAAAPAVPKP